MRNDSRWYPGACGSRVSDITRSVVALAASGSNDMSLYLPLATKTILSTLPEASADFTAHGKDVDVFDSADKIYHISRQDIAPHTTTQQRLVFIHKDIVRTRDSCDAKLTLHFLFTIRCVWSNVT
jgi:hypothetical protein